MAKKYKKEVLTLEEIGSIIYDRASGRYKNTNSAYSAAKKAALKLGIEDINGKKRNKLIAARDAEAIIALVLDPEAKAKQPEPVKTVKASKPLQISIFDLMETNDTSFASKSEPVVVKVPDEDKTNEALSKFLQARRELEAVIGCRIIIYFKDSFI